MSWERPWINEFEKLTKKMVDQRSAQVKELSDKPTSGDIGLAWLYPRLSFHEKGCDLWLTVSDSSGFGEFLGSGGSRVEYLRIFTRREKQYKVGITHEGFFDRLSKKLHIQTEYETGNPDFDSRYLIRADNPTDRAIIESGGFQQAVLGGEPFETVALWNHTAHMSQMIEAAELLEYENASHFISRFVQLLRAVDGFDGSMIR